MPVFAAGTDTLGLTQVRWPCEVSRLNEAVSVSLPALLCWHCLCCFEADPHLFVALTPLYLRAPFLPYIQVAVWVDATLNFYLYPRCSFCGV